MRSRLAAWGLGAGAVAGALDVALVAAADPGATRWVLAQSFAAWTAMGWAAVASESGLPSLLHGLAATLALDLAWILALGPGAGHPEHTAPLVVMALVFGAGFGWAHGRARPR